MATGGGAGGQSRVCKEKGHAPGVLATGEEEGGKAQWELICQVLLVAHLCSGNKL